jgi:hypothetical protein
MSAQKAQKFISLCPLWQEKIAKAPPHHMEGFSDDSVTLSVLLALLFGGKGMTELIASQLSKEPFNFLGEREGNQISSPYILIY